MDHERHMRKAIEVARNNRRAPFGTVLVDIEGDRTVMEGLNRSAENPILHGEMDAINRYANDGSNRWACKIIGGVLADECDRLFEMARMS